MATLATIRLDYFSGPRSLRATVLLWKYLFVDLKYVVLLENDLVTRRVTWHHQMIVNCRYDVTLRRHRIYDHPKPFSVIADFYGITNFDSVYELLPGEEKGVWIQPVAFARRLPIIEYWGCHVGVNKPFEYVLYAKGVLGVNVAVFIIE